MKKEVNKKQVTKSSIKHKKNVTKTFLYALSILSILGFLEILSISLFEFDFGLYTEALLMLVLGIALIIESQIRQLYTLKEGIDTDNFPKLITLVIGSVSVIAGILSFPQIRIEHPTFAAIKGILSIIAILIIIISTWINGKKEN